MSLPAYVAELHRLASMPADRTGSAETEHLSAGRCMTCGRRAHTHFECPGVNLEEPVEHAKPYTWDELGSIRKRDAK
jgi:hypothetical protein